LNEAPIRITCRHLEPSAAVEDCVREQVAALARECDHIMACHVCIERLAARSDATAFRVNVDLTMPGRQIAVHSGNPRDSTADLCAILNETFATLRALLRERVTPAARRAATQNPVCS
jgi:ribosome-associated translation inhibitor RaiA